jgi:hypothetical protein
MSLGMNGEPRSLGKPPIPRSRECFPAPGFCSRARFPAHPRLLLALQDPYQRLRCASSSPPRFAVKSRAPAPAVTVESPNGESHSACKHGWRMSFVDAAAGSYIGSYSWSSSKSAGTLRDSPIRWRRKP